jgi:hypothetical protein
MTAFLLKSLRSEFYAVAPGVGAVRFLVGIVDFIRHPSCPRGYVKGSSSGCGSGESSGWWWDNWDNADGHSSDASGGSDGGGCGGGG